MSAQLDRVQERIQNEMSLESSHSHPSIVTQIDYVNYLIPGLKDIVNCPFYWGKIDRYEAEKCLENAPEGAFLLRDSAQDEFVFSVGFRRYSRSLHARIEESRHEFSFDCHIRQISKKNIDKISLFFKTFCEWHPKYHCPEE